LDPLRSPFELEAKWKTRRTRRIGRRTGPSSVFEGKSRRRQRGGCLCWS